MAKCLTDRNKDRQMLRNHMDTYAYIDHMLILIIFPGKQLASVMYATWFVKKKMFISHKFTNHTSEQHCFVLSIHFTK